MVAEACTPQYRYLYPKRGRDRVKVGEFGVLDGRQNPRLHRRACAHEPTYGELQNE